MQRKDILKKQLNELPTLNILEVTRYEILTCWWLRFALKILPWDVLADYFIRHAEKKYDRYMANKDLYAAAKKSVMSKEKMKKYLDKDETTQKDHHRP